MIVPPPTGIAAIDSANLASSISECPAGGVVQMQAGTYALGTSGLSISKNITLRGTGGADALWANFGTLITFTSTTGVAIGISSHGVRLDNFALQNTGTPTAGAGIQTTTGGGNSTHYGPNLSVRGFYYNVDHQAGFEWFMDPSFFSYDFVQCGLRIQNVDSVDAGDMVVSGLFIAGPNNNAHAAIQWLTGGGFRGESIKINNRNAKTCLIGVNMELQDGVTTSDFLLSNSSIENVSWGFLCENAGPSNTGAFSNIILQANEWLCVGGSGTQCVAIAPATTSRVSAVNIGGNVIVGGSAQNGVYFSNLNNASHGPNIFVTNLGYHDAGGNTSITAVGNG